MFFQSKHFHLISDIRRIYTAWMNFKDFLLRQMIVDIHAQCHFAIISCRYFFVCSIAAVFVSRRLYHLEHMMLI